MTIDSQDEVNVQAFVEAARSFCEFVDTASTVETLAERLTIARRRLATLVATGCALPAVEASSDRILLWDGTPPGSPGFGPHDIYWEVFDPYVDEERVAGSLSEDFLDIYADVKGGLVAFDKGQHQDAIWEWRFQFDHHWGEHAVDALRALQRACTATAD